MGSAALIAGLVLLAACRSGGRSVGQSSHETKQVVPKSRPQPTPAAAATGADKDASGSTAAPETPNGDQVQAEQDSASVSVQGCSECSRVAYISHGPSQGLPHQLILWNGDNQGFVQLSHASGAGVSTFRWSKDGRHIAYLAMDYTWGGPHLHIASTTPPYQDIEVRHESFAPAYPYFIKWAPDGRLSVAFLREGAQNERNVYAEFSSTGAELFRIIDVALPLGQPDNLRYSLDGRRLLFAYSLGFAEIDRVTHVQRLIYDAAKDNRYLVPAGLLGNGRLVAGTMSISPFGTAGPVINEAGVLVSASETRPMLIHEPVESPDARHLALQFAGSTPSDVYLVSLDDAIAGFRQLTHVDPDKQAATSILRWQRDASAIFTVRELADGTQLIKVRRCDGKESIIATGQGIQPAGSPTVAAANDSFVFFTRSASNRSALAVFDLEQAREVALLIAQRVRARLQPGPHTTLAIIHTDDYRQAGHLSVFSPRSGLRTVSDDAELDFPAQVTWEGEDE